MKDELKSFLGTLNICMNIMPHSGVSSRENVGQSVCKAFREWKKASVDDGLLRRHRLAFIPPVSKVSTKIEEDPRVQIRHNRALF